MRAFEQLMGSGFSGQKAGLVLAHAQGSRQAGRVAALERVGEAI